jgi:hypothetical protein
VQHLVVARLVDDLRRLEQLLVLAADVLDELAAHQHGAVLAGHQHRQSPARHGMVDLDPLRWGEPVPEAGAVDVDEVVGNEPAVALERSLPFDVAGGVPLVELRLLVEPAHVGVLAVVEVAEKRDVLDIDLMPVLHSCLRRGSLPHPIAFLP